MLYTYKITLADLLLKFKEENGYTAEIDNELPGWFRATYPGCNLRLQWNPGVVNLEAKVEFKDTNSELLFWLKW
jgi:hypothetical protein